MFEILQQIWYWYNQIPHLILYLVKTLALQIWSSLQYIYTNLPYQQQQQVLFLIDNSDILFGVSFTAFLLFTLGKRKRRATWTDVFLTIFWSALCVGVMGFFQMVVSQFGIFYQTHDSLQVGTVPLDEKDRFLATFPLDFQPYLKYNDMIHFLEINGPTGRLYYGIYLIVDYLLLISTTILHRQLFSITFDEENDSSVAQMYGSQYIPLIVAGLDAYENMNYFTMLYYWQKMMKAGVGSKLEITPQFVSRTAVATQYKFNLIYILIGLQLAGLVAYLFDGKKKEEPKVEKKEQKKEAPAKKNKKKK
ncbi:hypothetical protein HK103_006981 [Boothiomyces macroporosus]|uniref:Uncharacterized protein n=1 Tax=Boothiomyces macroporosus TaxID=261099 RepID=A0AAD5UL03_9FUNG|nr:hypothetical protein HK103_006981 [Boothiomyces macroporosus]